MIGAFLGVLKSYRKLLQCIRVARRGELLQPPEETISTRSNALVPAPTAQWKHEGFGNIHGRISTIRSLDLLRETEPVDLPANASYLQEFKILAASYVPEDIVQFYGVHWTLINATARSAIKYVPIMCLYGAFFYTFFGLLAVLSNLASMVLLGFTMYRMYRHANQ